MPTMSTKHSPRHATGSRPPRAESRAQPRSTSAAGEPGADAARQVARTAAQEVRILGGQWRRTPLPVPTSAGLRPTPSRVRETLFNWLGQDLSGWRVLDAYAGSGALGLEAASRGAEQAVLIEREPALVRHLRATVSKLKATTVVVHQADALVWMRQVAAPARFDLVMLDPPFETADFLHTVEAALKALQPGGWLYLESPQPWDELLAAATDRPGAAHLRQLRVHRQGQAGAVHFHLLQDKVEATEPAA